MTSPAREPSPRLIADSIERLRKDNAALSRLVTEMKEREAKLVRALQQMQDAPGQSVGRIRVDGDNWDVVMTTGHVWRKVTKFIGDEHESRYFEEWISRPAVPGSRPAIFQRLEDALPAVFVPGEAA